MKLSEILDELSEAKEWYTILKDGKETSEDYKIPNKEAAQSRAKKLQDKDPGNAKYTIKKIED